ncbi:MAG TPA: CHASE3 domain-containing protein, partial [Baekduia sp.]|nr:CHASE3 domain-containing protein [Baekduia sp.]
MSKGAQRRGLIGPTLAAFAAVGVLVCIVFAFLLEGMSSMKSNADLARRAERVVLLTSRLNRLTVDLETGVRGRLLTGDDQYLAPYRTAQRQIPIAESRLTALVKDPAQRVRLAQLQERVEGYRTGWATMAARLPLGLTRSELDAHLANGKAQLDALRARFDTFRTEELDLSDRKNDKAASASDRATIFGIGGLVLILGGLAALGWFSVRWIRREAAAAI